MQKKGTILIVDDEPAIRGIIRHALSEKDFNVFEAENGKEAVDFVQTNVDAIDLTIMDINMPIMNGLEAYQVIKRISPYLEIILMTGILPDVATAKVIKEEKLKILYKPFSFDKLLELVSKKFEKVR